ncbi:MAG: BON domain-containing protein [Acidobacteria bacterium]|nr:BON domain-containing protein [Acidobacteriota bacterium]
MRQIVLCCAVLLSAVVLLAQQGQPPPTTPPTFPEGQTPRSQVPPDTQAPPAEKMSDQAVEGKIVDQLRAEPALSRTNVDARVDQDSVVLKGSVDNMAQHDLAVRIAEENAGGRNVVDNIKVKQQT